MKKIILLYVIGLLVLLSGCKTPAPDINEIRQDITLETRTISVSGVQHILSIDSFEIEKRMTEERDDEVYCTFIMSDDFFELEGNYYCHYKYYDEGGWILEDSSISDTVISIISDDMPDIVNQYVSEESYWMGDTYYDIESVEWEKHDNSGYIINYNLIKQREYACDTCEVTLFCFIDGNKNNYDWEIEDSKYGFNTVWNVVGTYKSQEYLGEYAEIVIDSYNPDTNEVHIAYAKHGDNQRAWWLGGTYEHEKSDVTVIAEAVGEGQGKYLGMDICGEYHESEESLRIYKDKLSFSLLRMEKIE